MERQKIPFVLIDPDPNRDDEGTVQSEEPNGECRESTEEEKAAALRILLGSLQGDPLIAATCTILRFMCQSFPERVEAVLNEERGKVATAAERQLWKILPDAPEG